MLFKWRETLSRRLHLCVGCRCATAPPVAAAAFDNLLAEFLALKWCTAKLKFSFVVLDFQNSNKRLMRNKYSRVVARFLSVQIQCTIRSKRLLHVLRLDHKSSPGRHFMIGRQGSKDRRAINSRFFITLIHVNITRNTNVSLDFVPSASRPSC